MRQRKNLHEFKALERSPRLETLFASPQPPWGGAQTPTGATARGSQRRPPRRADRGAGAPGRVLGRRAPARTPTTTFDGACLGRTHRYARPGRSLHQRPLPMAHDRGSEGRRALPRGDASMWAPAARPHDTRRGSRPPPRHAGRPRPPGRPRLGEQPHHRPAASAQGRRPSDRPHPRPLASHPRAHEGPRPLLSTCPLHAPLLQVHLPPRSRQPFPATRAGYP
jgi:hypothetical protein